MTPSEFFGNIDCIEVANGRLHLSGWAIFANGKSFYAPEKYILELNSRIAKIFPPNCERNDISEFYDTRERKCGFNISLNLSGYPVSAIEDTAKNLRIYARHQNECLEIAKREGCSPCSNDYSEAAEYALYRPERDRFKGKIERIIRDKGSIKIDGWGVFQTRNDTASPQRYVLLVNGQPVTSFLPRPEAQGDGNREAGRFSEEIAIQGLQKEGAGEIAVYAIDRANQYYPLATVFGHNGQNAACKAEGGKCAAEKPLADYKLGCDFTEADIVANGCMAGEDKDVLSVLWSMTDGCNYDCSYCWCSKKFKKFSTLEQLKKGADTLFAMNRPGYQITLYGGEPTYHPHCLELMEYICGKNVNVKLRMISNGSRKPEYYRRMFALLNGKQFALALSLHLEHADVDNYCAVVELAASQGINVGVNFMMIANHFEKAKYAAEKLLKIREEYPFFFDMPYVYDFEGNFANEISEEEAQFRKDMLKRFSSFPVQPKGMTPFYTRLESDIQIRKRGKLINLPRGISRQLINDNRTPSYKNYYCVQGSNVYYITDFGGVLGSVCNIGDMMGNIFTDDAKVLIERMHCKKCTMEGCNSIENIPIPKFVESFDAQQYLPSKKEVYENLLAGRSTNTKVNPAINYICDLNVDEIELNKPGVEIISSGSLEPDDRDTLSVLWAITEGCNYKCPYCFCRKTFKPFSTEADLCAAVDKLLCLNRPGYNFHIYGGEPTYHPHCARLIEYINLSAPKAKLLLLTNASQTEEYFDSLISKAPNLNGFNLSLHPQFANIEHFIAIISLLNSAHKNIHVNFLFPKGMIETIKIYGTKLLEARSKYEFFINIYHPFDNAGYRGEGVSEDEKKYFDLLGSEFNKFGIPANMEFPGLDRTTPNFEISFNSQRFTTLKKWSSKKIIGLSSSLPFNNYYCCSGTNVYYICEDGSIMGAACKDAAYLGNLFSSTHSELLNNMKPIKCSLYSCSCPTNFPIPKFYALADAERYIKEYKNRNEDRILK